MSCYQEHYLSLSNEILSITASAVQNSDINITIGCRSDDPYDTVLSVVPSTKSEKTLKTLSEEGYDDGPDASQVFEYCVITQTRPCNIQQYFTAVKIMIFR